MTYFFGFLGGFPLILVNYLIPIIIFYIPLPHYEGWMNNYFVEISYKINVWCAFSFLTCCHPLLFDCFTPSIFISFLLLFHFSLILFLFAFLTPFPPPSSSSFSLSLLDLPLLPSSLSYLPQSPPPFIIVISLR